MNNFLQFWSAWLRGPHRVGAVAPSSPALAQAMLDAINDEHSGKIVELGAGTGAITRFLAEKYSTERLIIIERDAHLAKLLRDQLPGHTILTTDARHLGQSLNGYPCAAVVSALPLLSLPSDDRRAIVAAIAEHIGAAGQLIQFTYGFGAPIPKDEAREFGLQGQRTRFVLWNLPPASVWTYTQQQPSATHSV